MVTKCLPSGHYVVNMWSPSGHQLILMGPIDEMVNKNWVTSAKTKENLRVFKVRASKYGDTKTKRALFLVGYTKREWLQPLYTC